jgi:hypothetical protein
MEGAMTHVYVLQHEGFVIGAYSTWEKAVLARADAALERDTTKWDEAFNITPHRLDYNVDVFNLKPWHEVRRVR